VLVQEERDDDDISMNVCVKCSGKGIAENRLGCDDQRGQMTVFYKILV
jgi:hypothetical protein